MRIYSRNDNGAVDNTKPYETMRIDTDQAFPLGTFTLGNDYAIEGPEGDLKWLNCAWVHEGCEYCEFSGQEVKRFRGKIIWRR